MAPPCSFSTPQESRHTLRKGSLSRRRYGMGPQVEVENGLGEGDIDYGARLLVSNHNNHLVLAFPPQRNRLSLADAVTNGIEYDAREPGTIESMTDDVGYQRQTMGRWQHMNQRPLSYTNIAVLGILYWVYYCGRVR